jgi:branched-chain amino acid transport system permease protein
VSEFLSYLVSGLAIGCGFSLIASGLVIIHRVTRVVNLAQGMYAVVAALSATTFLAAGLPHGVAELCAVLVSVVAGLITGVVAIGRRGTTPLSSLIITFGIGIFAYAVEVLTWGDGPRSFPGIPGAVEVAGVRIQFQYVFVVLVTALVFLVLELFFERTFVGKALSACSSNPYAARVVGIDVTRMGIFTFALGGALGGLAGVLLGPLRPTSFDSDVPLVIDGFAAAILGGLTRPMLALAGGILLGVAEAMVAGYLNGSYQTEVALVLMLAVMVGQTVGRPSLEGEVS